MDLQLEGKKALITGSTAGIGLAAAKRLAGEGVEVVINGRGQDRIDAAIAEIKKNKPEAEVSGIACDFGKKEEVDRLLNKLAEVDILINNVGTFDPKPFAEIDDEEWFHTFEVNVLSGVRLSRKYFQKMLDKNWGRIIFISSESAMYIPEEMIQYGMTKTAQLAVSRGLAELTKGTDVTVNSVLPGPTYTEGVKNMTDEAFGSDASREEREEKFFESARPSSLLQRFAEPEEIANMIAYVASPLSSATNGASLRVEGGLVRTIY